MLSKKGPFAHERSASPIELDGDATSSQAEPASATTHETDLSKSSDTTGVTQSQAPDEKADLDVLAAAGIDNVQDDPTMPCLTLRM